MSSAITSRNVLLMLLSVSGGWTFGLLLAHQFSPDPTLFWNLFASGNMGVFAGSGLRFWRDRRRNSPQVHPGEEEKRFGLWSAKPHAADSWDRTANIVVDSQYKSRDVESP